MIRDMFIDIIVGVINFYMGNNVVYVCIFCDDCIVKF